MPIPYPPGEPLTCQQIRELDILAIEHVGIPGIVLMENAARGAAEFIYEKLMNPAASRAVILCGPGNNGGDGLAIARHLKNAGVRPTVVLAAPPERYRDDAGVNLRILQRIDCPLLEAHAEPISPQVEEAILEADVLVDALLGTAASGAPRGTLAGLVELANAARGRRVAIDIPTGLDADTGRTHTPCLRADATVTFVAAKTGFDAPAARACLGHVVVVDIGAPRELIPGRKESPHTP